ncbi:MAG: hypothetical protein NUV65_04505 [Candidatus Roizmanbacteria bacterium]|nr:hypothetical protein [Candidatus Roizmanbacteria bacterium]
MKFSETMPYTGWPVNSSFRWRYAMEIGPETYVPKTESILCNHTGDYGTDVLCNEHADSLRLLEPLTLSEMFPLHGLEQLYMQRINELLEQGKNESPVVVLDVGGMLGHSWARLAHVFREEVQQSKVAFVVSNARFYPEFDITDFVTPRERHFLEFFDITKQYMHYVVGTVSKLRHLEITLPNGKSLPLAKNVDIINERKAASFWTNVPELVVPQIASMLSDDGLYIADSGLHILGDQLPIDAPPHEKRLFHAFTLAQENLCLDRVSRIEAGNYIGSHIPNRMVLRKENAPLVSLS